MSGYAFGAGVAVWIGGTGLYLGAGYLVGWAYTGHWPIHGWMLGISSVIAAAPHAFRAAKECAE